MRWIWSKLREWVLDPCEHDYQCALRGTYAGIGLLGLLAPVIGKGIGSLISHKQKKGEEKKKIAYDQQLAAAKEAQDRADFEAAQDTPQAAMSRLKFNTKLAQILGKFGGREKTPGFLTSAFDTARKRKEFTPGAAFVPPPTSGGGFWGFAGGLADALSYFDPSKLKKPVGQTPDFANIGKRVAQNAATQGGLGALQTPLAKNPFPQPQRPFFRK